MKVWIDQDLCTGDGLCEEIAPTVFTLLDDGLAYVKDGDKVLSDPGGAEGIAPVPAGQEEAPGRYRVSSIQATASFRYGRWVPEYVRRFGIRAIIGKGGMDGAIYRDTFASTGTVFLTTVGYGIAALYGRGVQGVDAVYWKDELGLPFRRYMLWRKLTRAMLAIGRERSIADAAHGSAFADAAHLTRTFNEMFGIPPSVMMRGEFFQIASPFSTGAAPLQQPSR